MMFWTEIGIEFNEITREYINSSERPVESDREDGEIDLCLKKM